MGTHSPRGAGSTANYMGWSGVRCTKVLVDARACRHYVERSTGFVSCQRPNGSFIERSVLSLSSATILSSVYDRQRLRNRGQSELLSVNSNALTQKVAL